LIHAQAVGKPRRDLVEALPIRETPVLMHCEAADVLARLAIELSAGLCNIEQALVRGECEPVRSVEIVRRDRQVARGGIQAIERRWQLGSLFPTLVVGVDT